MPKSNGFQVCRTIREQLQPTKIIVVSGRDYAVDRTNAFQAGADEYLLKPVTWDLLHGCDRTTSARTVRNPAACENAAIGNSSPARVKFWGVRGSIPVPGPTPWVTAETPAASKSAQMARSSFSMPATGIRALGLALDKEFGARSIKLTLLITHTHWDHIQGLPFFSPAYDQKEFDSRSGL